MRLKIVVPTYNAARWIKTCLLSIVRQRFRDFTCLVIDDASHDDTWNIIQSLDFLDERFLMMRNPTNLGPLANTYNGFERLGCRRDPEAVLTIVDGDDRLAHDDAFGVVERAYASDSNLLMTYGNYANDTEPSIGKCGEFPESVISGRNFRNHLACVSCLRTFKAKLWNGLKKQDLIDPMNGKFFAAGGDVAYCLPLLDMAGNRFKFVKEIIYIYTTSNPISDSKIRGYEQSRVDALIRSRPKYPLL